MVPIPLLIQFMFVRPSPEVSIPTICPSDGSKLHVYVRPSLGVKIGQARGSFVNGGYIHDPIYGTFRSDSDTSRTFSSTMRGHLEDNDIVFPQCVCECEYNVMARAVSQLHNVVQFRMISHEGKYDPDISIHYNHPHQL